MFKIKRNRKRSKIFLILPLSLIPVILSIFVFLKFTQMSIISPVPFGKTFTFNKDNDPRLREIKKLLSKTNIEYNSLEIVNNSSFLLILKNNEEVIFSSKKDFASQISSLQLIITRSTIEGKRINRLDFRFDRPVITYR